MSTNRVPIVDKNGKQTHVWRSDDKGFNAVERIASAAAPEPASFIPQSDAMSDAMDNLWDDVSALGRAADSIKKTRELRNSESVGGAANALLWNNTAAKQTEVVYEHALSAQSHIEDLEAELTAFENTPLDDRDAEDTEYYETGVIELRFQKSNIFKHLTTAGVFDKPTFLSHRVTRTWEASVDAAKEIYGEPDIEQELPNGSTTFRYDKTDDGGFREFTVNRMGNVTRFNSPEGEFIASNIDFPINGLTGEMILRGESNGGLTMQDSQRIAFIATGERDTWIR
jgi:hypothetical protein